MAYQYYVVRLDFEDGRYGYVRGDGCGGYEITDYAGDALIFDTHSEAQDFYYNNFGRSTTCGGSRIKKVFITTITSQRPL